MNGYVGIDGQMVNLSGPITYDMSDKVMRTGRGGRRKLQNNTYLERIDEHTVGVRLHDTHVVKLHDDGSTSLDSGGWHTMTTKERINDYIDYPLLRVTSDRGRWYLATGWGAEDRIHRFFDGIRIKDGKVLNPRRAEMKAQDEREKGIEKRMAKYIKGFIAALKSPEGIPQPGPGDCWGCTSGGAMGNSHLLDHFDEDYFVPTLLVNAYKARGYGDYTFVMQYEFGLTEDGNIRLRQAHRDKDVRRNLRRYLKPLVLTEVQR